jgi:hypothetical protein
MRRTAGGAPAVACDYRTGRAPVHLGGVPCARTAPCIVPASNSAAGVRGAAHWDGTRRPRRCAATSQTSTPTCRRCHPAGRRPRHRHRRSGPLTRLKITGPRHRGAGSPARPARADHPDTAGQALFKSQSACGARSAATRALAAPFYWSRQLRSVMALMPVGQFGATVGVPDVDGWAAGRLCGGFSASLVPRA